MPSDVTPRPVWLVPTVSEDLPRIERGRPRLAGLVSVAAVAALVPALILFAPKSTWRPEDLLVVLLACGFVSYAAAVRLRRATLDAGFSIALISLVFLGPVPAALAFSAPELGRWMEGHPTPRFAGNVASFGFGVLASSVVLRALEGASPIDLDVAAYGAIAVAGIVLVLVNYILTTLLVQVLHDGIRMRVAIRQELIPSSPVDAVLIGAALLTVFLYDRLGIAGLAPLGMMLLVPRVLTPHLMRREAVSQLPRSTATALYAEAIADELGLDRNRKRILADASSHLGGSASLTRLEDFTAVMRTVLHHRERWDGNAGGAPGLVSGDEIPLESRVLAVANAWSLLTAEGNQGLSSEQALYELKARAGSEFDPEVVAAAVRAVQDRFVSGGA